MQRLKRSGLYALAFCWLLPMAGYAQTSKLTCGHGKSIGESLKKLKPGDTLLVSGTCIENLLIPEEVLNVVLDGQGTAQINPLNPNDNTVNIRGRGIVLKRFIVAGGNRAIALQNGAAAILTENVIERAQTFGVQISRNTFARVLGNTIRDNGSDGVNVRLGSGADIFNNLIAGNRGGVNVDSGGSADISGNHIFGNAEDGVRLRDNSHVRFSDDPDNDRINVIELNGDNGVDCARGGTISGAPVSFGAGNAGGNTNIAANCIVQSGVLP